MFGDYAQALFSPSMKSWLTLLLACSWVLGHAQGPAAGQVYADVRAGYRLVYPSTWLVAEQENPPGVTFYTGAEQRPAPAEATLSLLALPESQQELNPLAQGQLDTLWQLIRRLPQGRVLLLEQQDAGSYQEISYDYTYQAGPAAGRTRVLGRRLWRGGYRYQLEFRSPAAQAARYLPEARPLLESLTLTGSPPPLRRYAEQGCDDKMYGIAALRLRNGNWEDDCRSIHEFSVSDPEAAPRVHSLALPFQAYALAKGFDNCLYAVTKAPTDAPEYVYRYDPGTRQGRYTGWQLPAQGGESVWISAATDARGDLYFITSDANKLVKVSPLDNTVTLVWETDPLRQAAYYPAIGFAGAGTHANFCLDDAGTLYQVYSTDGSLLKIDLATRRPAPDITPLEGLPERGGYSDLLMQLDAQGRRRLFLAGPKALYRVDLAQRRAHLVRRGIYTDLAGCNLFRGMAPPAPTPPGPPPAPGAFTWRGRVLDARTLQPLPQAQLNMRASGPELRLPLATDGSFEAPAAAGQPFTVQARLPGYLPFDSLYTARRGAFVHDVLLRPLVVGATLPLANVQFEQGQAVLLRSSYGALDQLLGLLTQNPGLRIELRGHTDNVGDAEKNVQLSEQRVAVVKLYLVGRGVSPERIRGVGLGGAEPRASNEREETRRLNRRVEFRVTDLR